MPNLGFIGLGAKGLSATALAAQFMNALVGAGGGERDSSALIEVLERLNGMEP